MVAVPIVMTALALLSRPLNDLRSRRVSNFNRQLQYNIDHNLVKGRADNEICTEQDLEIIGAALIATNSPLLANLSATQALVLSKIALDKLRILADNDVFPQKTRVSTQKFLRLIEMDRDSDYDLLAKTLQSEDIQIVFEDEPAILQALLQNLSKQALGDDDVRQGLKVSLKGLTKKHAKLDDEYWDDAILNIATGHSIDSFFPKAVVVENENINLKVAGKTFTLKKKEAIAVSTKINSFFEEFPELNEMVLEDSVKPEWVQVLEEIARGNQIELSEKKVLDVLEAAHYFDMKPPVEKCDNYLLAHGITKELVVKWKKSNGESVEKGEAFKAKWEFCDRFALLQAKQTLAMKYVKQLKSLTGDEADSSCLEKIKLLNLSHVRDGEALKFYNLFRERLRNHQFLSWAWKIGSNVEIMRQAVIEFCMDPNNKDTVEIAWATLPEDLKEALKGSKGVAGSFNSKFKSKSSRQDQDQKDDK